jgi:multidrug resistance efflux pump/primosomal replication protein N
MKYRAIVFVLMLIVLTGCGDNDVPTGGATKEGPRTHTLLARAEFDSLEEKLVSPPFSTEVLQLLPEGTRVSAGEEVSLLSPGNRFEQLQEKSMELEQHAILVEREKQLLEMNKRVVALDDELAQLDMQSRTIEYERAVELRDWQRLMELRETATAEKIREKMLRKQLAAGTAMAAKGFIARQELENTIRELDVLQVNASLTCQLLPYLEAVPDRRNLFKADQELDRARIKAEVASHSRAKSIADSYLALNSAIRQHDYTALEVSDLKRQIASLSLLTPTEGIVIHGQTYDGAGYTKVKTGSQVFPGIFFLRIVNPARNGIVFSFDQQDAHLVASVSQLYFQADAFPEKLVEAKTDSMIPMALEIPGSNPEGRTHVAIRAEAASYPADFRLGYSGTVYAYDVVAEILARFQGSRRHEVGRRPFRRVVSNTGDVKPASATGILSGISEGKLNHIETEGKTVKKGDPIAVIGCEQLRQEAGDVEIQMKKKNEEYQLQLQKNEVDRERLARALEVRRGALEVAKLKHAALLKSREEDKIIDLQRSIELLDARIALAKEKISHVKELQRRGLSSEQDLLTAGNELAVMLKDRAIARYRLDLEESGPTKRSVRLSELEVRRAEIEMNKAEIEAQMGNFRNQMEARIQQAAIRRLEINHSGLDRQLKNADVRAPADGVVIHNEFHKSGGGIAKAKIGDAIHRRIPFMQIADLKHLQVHTTVSEMDVKFIKPGDEVRLTLKGNSVRSFPGWVSSVGLVAATDFKTRQDAVVPVVIDLVPPGNGSAPVDPAFRPGNTCEVEFKLYDLAETVFVPTDALLPAATSSCVVMADGGIRPVEILFSDGLRGCAVASGLQPGEVILLQEPAND